MNSGALIRRAATALFVFVNAARADLSPSTLTLTSLPPGQSQWPSDALRQREFQPELASLIFVFSCITNIVNSQYRAAVRDCSSAIVLDPDNASPYKFRGEAYFLQGAYISALADFDRSAAMDPTDAAAFAARAETYSALHDFHHALTNFDLAIRFSPEEPRYWSGRCWLRAVWNRNLKTALSDCTTAHRLSPQFAPAMDGRAFVYFRMSAYKRAIRDYDVAIKLQNTYARAYFGRGLAKLHLRYTASGRADIVKARAIDRDVDTLFASMGVTGEGLSMPRRTRIRARRHSPPAPGPSGAEQVPNKLFDSKSF